MPGAGDLDNRFTLQRDVAEPDWTGHPGDPDWQDQFTVWGKITFMRGGETVIAARLTARQPAILPIRISAQALTILPSDRIADARTAEMFNIREQPRRSRCGNRCPRARRPHHCAAAAAEDCLRSAQREEGDRTVASLG